MIASSVGTEKSGVPMKTILSGIRGTPRGQRWTVGASLERGLAARLLLQSSHHDVALQPRQEIDDELAVQMVDLVLESGRQEAFGGKLLALSLAVDVGNRHGRGALDVEPEIGDRQAALLVEAHLRALGQDFRVEECQR